MPRYKYTGLNLGQVLSRHGGDLATQTECGWLSFDPKKDFRVKLAGPGQSGFLHPHKSVSRFGAELFDSKSDAENDALAKLLHHTQHEGQLSTLPAKRRAAVKARSPLRRPPMWVAWRRSAPAHQQTAPGASGIDRSTAAVSGLPRPHAIPRR